jgi:hypothetical protein
MMIDQLFMPRCAGGGRIEQQSDGVRLALSAATAGAYSNAQLDDYGLLPGMALVRHPPLHLRVRARFRHSADALRGTAGFGFWNYPWAGVPRLPRAVWFFFGSPPGDLPLAYGVPGHGWKAAVIDAGRPRALALMPFAPLAVALMRRPRWYRLLWPRIQRAVGVAEAALDLALDEWHTYELEWGVRFSQFWVDGKMVLADAPSPRGPLCFVAWIDNQYAIVTPQGRFGWGLLAAEAQGIELAEFTIAAR